MISIERVRSLLTYDAATGAFFWTKTGKRAGTVAEEYIRVRIDNKTYRGHRLAWAYFYGRWPVQDIDHIDTVKTNNAISNLREVSNAQNAQNTRRPKGTTASNCIGVSWHKHSKKWQARIMKDGKSISLGYFRLKEEASNAYWDAKKLHHPHAQLPARR